MGSTTSAFPIVNVLGVGLTAAWLEQTVDEIARWIQNRERGYVCLAPAHSVMDCYRDPQLRENFNRSAMVVPDRMSMVWLAKLSGHGQVGRVYGPDLMHALCVASLPHGFSHYFYGGGEGVAAELAIKLQERYPGLKVAGSFTPPFRRLGTLEDVEVVRQINTANPDIVWVGLGSGKQERWMAEHRERLQAPVLIGVGAAFDFLSGRKPQAARWIQRSGLEWLFRLRTEPRRLWPRYREYPMFVLLVAAQRLGLRQYPMI
jgi:N-acetylglucosaminyldiphosphoundecaprenol N-acetyl-beta-D-mannosaminyltransferase